MRLYLGPISITNLHTLHNLSFGPTSPHELSAHVGLGLPQAPLSFTASAILDISTSKSPRIYNEIGASVTSHGISPSARPSS